ncbi:flavin reductase [candidate division KSB1 bacterium]|nr:flavin reductase [candidate division KSB1 bacterium]
MAIKRKKMDVLKLELDVFDLWLKQGMLLTCGDYLQGDYNTMTVGWGSIGVMWNKPFVQVVVRPTRYTYEFMEKYDTFTLCAFPKAFRKDLQFLGSRSGRDGDKIARSGLTPEASILVAAPCFEQAGLVFECKKIYFDDFKPAQFLDAAIEGKYPLKDYHRIYFGEILGVFGIETT